MGKRSVPETSQTPHAPVLIEEVLEALSPVAGRLIIDGTFGAGGYSRAFLSAGASVIAIDRDPTVATYADVLSEEYGESIRFRQGRFSQLDTVVDDDVPIDAVVLDIGVSSMQLDDPARGFSFMRDGPLDMRMGTDGVSAADIVNDLAVEPLANLIFAFGEERRSRRIAQFIVAAREDGPIESTGRLAGIIEKAIGRRPGDSHPATRTFQALRIAVNREFDELVEGLFAAERRLDEDGILAVVTFHSLEDRIVKRFLDSGRAGAARSRYMPQASVPERRWHDIAKPRKSGTSELSRNPRARSATLRTARRTSVPARDIDATGLGVPMPRGVA